MPKTQQSWLQSSILRHRGIWGAADKAVLNKVLFKNIEGWLAVSFSLTYRLYIWTLLIKYTTTSLDCPWYKYSYLQDRSRTCETWRDVPAPGPRDAMRRTSPSGTRPLREMTRPLRRPSHPAGSVSKISLRSRLQGRRRLLRLRSLCAGRWRLLRPLFSWYSHGDPHSRWGRECGQNFNDDINY